MFQVGEMVCYPMHGVGRVEAIQEQSILGETNQYYLLRFLMGRMTALVPVKNAHSVGLRPLIDEGTCGKVVAFLQSDSCSQESDNRIVRRRAKDVSHRPSGAGGGAVRIQRSGGGGVPALGGRRLKAIRWQGSAFVGRVSLTIYKSFLPGDAAKTPLFCLHFSFEISLDTA